MIQMFAIVKTAFSMSSVASLCGLLGLCVGFVGESIGSDTPITMFGACFVGGLIWYLASTLQRLKDGQKNTNERLTKIEFILNLRKLASTEEKETTT
jgi:hypothetical protein